KFLAYNPRIGTSHFTFISSLVEALVEAGHEVVMLAPELTDKVKIVDTKGARIIKDFLVSNKALEMADHAMVRSSDLFWTYKSDLDFAEILNTINLAAAEQCNATLHTPGLIERLKAEKFDAAFAEPIDLCGVGLFNLVGIQNYALALSVSTTEGTFELTGSPTTPSYVPGSMADFGDKMTFPQRVLNTMTLGFLYYFFSTQRILFHNVFEKAHPGMPDFFDIMANSSLFFSNCVPLTDFPRPTSHKIIDIGGISVSNGKEILDEKWSSILDRRSKTVLLSFGSAAQANRMPETYKKAIRYMVQSNPEVTFIVKYENPEDGFSKGLANLIESPWVPQRAMLKDARLSAFITHGGAGSTTESTHAGVPLLVVPLMGDQLRNAHLIERLGTGFKLSKEALTDGQALSKAVRRILEDPSFKEKASLVAAQLRDQPFSAREKVVRNMEFMAKYGPLKILDHYGPKLYWFQYYLIDVFAFLGIVVFSIIASIVYCTYRVSRCVFRRKQKTE
ncbi:hypothetical protein PFISCL1PPCAC_14524, partial [Pristionchus fissidentatus]